MDFNRLTLPLAEWTQTEYGLGWALTIGLIILGLIAVAIPRPRKALPKEMQAMEDKQKKKKKKKRGKGKGKKGKGGPKKNVSPIRRG